MRARHGPSGIAPRHAATAPASLERWMKSSRDLSSDALTTKGGALTYLNAMGGARTPYDFGAEQSIAAGRRAGVSLAWAAAITCAVLRPLRANCALLLE